MQTMIAIQVDDILFSGPDGKRMQLAVATRFKCTTSDGLEQFMGATFDFSDDGSSVHIHQTKQITRIVDRFRKLVNEKWRPKTPMNHAADRLHAGMSPAEPNNQLTCLYAELGCSMGYMCSSTSPQMCFGFKEVSRFMANPGEKHFDALMQLFHYAIEHGHTGLIYKAWVSKYKLTVMHDADFNGELDKRLSTSGVLIFLNDNLWDWACTSQKATARSTVESEYLCMAFAAFMVLKAYNLLVHIVGEDEIETPITFFCDNQGAICEATLEHGCHTRHTAHIDWNYHFFRQYIASGFFHAQYVPTHLNLSDFMTKALAPDLFERLTMAAMHNV